MDEGRGLFAGLAAFLNDQVQSLHADLLQFTCSGLIDSTIYNGANHSELPR